MEVWSPYPFLYVSSRIVMWECSARTHILTSSRWNFISSSHALLYHCLGMLDETVAFISLFRHHDCFLQSHLFLSSFPSCHQSASFVHRFCFLFFFFTLHRAVYGLLFDLFLFWMLMQTARVCIFEPTICLLDTAFCRSEDICHLGNQKIFFPRLFSVYLL